MDLHRPAFKMDSSSYLPGPLASPALMVLASTAESGRDASVPCQAPRPFGVPLSEKDLQLPFPHGSYSFASMYHRQGPVSGHGPFPARASLLHLHPQFHPPNLDCSSLGMLNPSGVGAFRPFSPPEERDSRGYRSAFSPASRLKGCYSEGAEYDFGGGRVLCASPGSRKASEDPGRKLFAVSGLLSDREASSSPEDPKEHCKGPVLFDPRAPLCPVCQAVLQPGELQAHVDQEMARLTQTYISGDPVQTDHPFGAPKSLSLSLHIKCEGGSTNSPPRAPEDPHSDRYQTFLRVRDNRHTRLNVRISKLKRRRPDHGQDILVNLGEEQDWTEQRRIHMTSVLGGVKGPVLLSSVVKEVRDSDGDLDVDGDDTQEYGRAQYTEADIVPCSAHEPGDFGDKPRGAVLNGGTLSNRLTLEHSKWTTEGNPSTNHGENSIGSLHRSCINRNIELVPEDSALTTLDALKTQIRDLEKQLSRGDRYKCLICMDTYSTPLTSIQCWHVHCEECWLRSLGAKKLCPQCNTITSPGDLRRVFL